MTKNNFNSGIVYSTGNGKMCSGCSKPIQQCTCSQNKSVPHGDGIVRVGRETKGRKGKGVTIITGISLDNENLKDLAKQLKQKCGSGGTIKNHIIEIQGDHRDVLVEELKKQGFTVKRSGG
jgi:translation initiation factor 1